MWEARNRRREALQLEARLRSARPAPRDDFVSSLSSRVALRRPPRAWSRVAFAGAFTTLLAGMFASFGGIGYAASGAGEAINTLTKLTIKDKVTVHSAASDQYGQPPAAPQPAQAVKPAAKTAVAGAAAAETGTLPFTGLSLLGTALAGGALLGIGLALRRRERNNS